MGFSNGFYRFLCPLVLKAIPIIGSGLSSSVLADDNKHRGNIQLYEEKFPKLPSRVRGSPIQILQTSSKQIVKIDTEVLNKVLDKVGGRPFAVISLNGPARTGKSFLLNYFIRYANSDKSKNWHKLAYGETLDGFEWRGKAKRCTTGINIWSEPLQVTQDGIPVILLDCQGAFDNQTSVHRNTIIFAISTLLSSVLIFNIMKQVDENLIQFLELFTSYATQGCPMLSERLAVGQVDVFQKLIVLVRDFDFVDYKYGFYSDLEVPEGQRQRKNFKVDHLNPGQNQPQETQEARENILSSFEQVAVYLMPDPGKELRRGDNLDYLDKEFTAHLTNFVERTLNPNNLVTKKIGGSEITGTDFKAYVKAWANFDWADKLPEVQTIRKTNQNIQYEQAKRLAMRHYKDEMTTSLSLEQYKMKEDALRRIHEDICQQSVQVYKNKPKMGGSTDDKRFYTEFNLATDAMLDEFKVLNNHKPDSSWTLILGAAGAIVGAIMMVLKWF